MCTGVEAGLLLTAIGGGAQAANTAISGRRQDRAAAQGIRRQGEIQREGNQRVNELVSEIATSTPAAEKAQALEGFINTLRQNAPTTGGSDDSFSLGDGRFAERVSGGEGETLRRGFETAGQLARIDSPLRQRERELAEAGRAAGDLSELSNRSSAEDFINRLRIASKRPNAAVDALGQVAKGIGSVVALRPGATGASLPKLFDAGTIIDAPVTAARTPGVFG